MLFLLFAFCGSVNALGDGLDDQNNGVEGHSPPFFTCSINKQLNLRNYLNKLSGIDFFFQRHQIINYILIAISLAYILSRSFLSDFQLSPLHDCQQG